MCRDGYGCHIWDSLACRFGTHPCFVQLEIQQEKIRAEERVFALENEVWLRVPPGRRFFPLLTHTSLTASIAHHVVLSYQLKLKELRWREDNAKRLFEVWLWKRCEAHRPRGLDR